MRTTVLVLALVALAVIAGGSILRTASGDAAVWHVDPLVVQKPAFPGHYLVRPQGGDEAGPVFDLTPEALLARFDAVALASPRVTRLAGAPEDGLVTYVARSPIVGFPDYISVRAVPVGDAQAQLAVFARLRYGWSDMGVNRKRVRDWFEQIATAPSG